MGVDDTSQQVENFHRYHKKITTIFIIISQTLLAFIAILLLVVLSLSSINDLWLIIILLSLLFAASAATLYFVNKITKPLYAMLTALAYKTGKQGAKPPNPNAKNYQKSGFRSILQYIYDKPSEDLKSGEANSDDNSDNKPTNLVSQALNNTNCGVVILDTDKKIIFANKSAPIANRQDGTPYLALDFMNEQTIEEWLADIDTKEIKAEQSWQRVPTTPGVIRNQRIFDVAVSYQKAAAGETVIVLFDRSKLYLPEEEDLNFIAFAAHELRGPITVIRGYLDILEQELKDRLKGDESELIHRLIVSSNRLSGYVNNILNVSRFDRHHLKINLAEDTISNVYASIADDMQSRASVQHRMLNINIPKDLPTVALDRASIGEVIVNLIDNAIKYSFEGGVITVSAAAKGDFVEVSVQDNGIGMPSNIVKNLFRKFYRSHRSRDTVAGTGIGLYISKAFIESHGGTITVRSKENEGSTFSFTIPIYATVKDKLLEDGQLNRRLIRHGGGWIKNHTMYRG